ncbi:hypothetical protein Acr_02g0012920 [Actinidia rufa]|uniref:Peptidase metallopeptidase domain-containing protein n=1 Tax=Actinidia rufa TaxID=165716 RepID=A0A7J0E9R0_9ERIC|nr:hypothetical protein Acr_02g0012920 [Actinidia rufa]
MATKVFQLCLCISHFFLVLPLSSHANPSEPKAEKSSPFEFINHLQGCHKGQKVKDLHKLKTYLEHFGYLNYLHSQNQTHANDDDFDDLLESAIKTYQLNYHLKVTGTLDAQTVSKMTAPRCGVPDIIDCTSNLRWPPSQTHFTYGFLPDTTPQAISAVTRAFNQWASATHFIFSQAQVYANANMKISFHRRDHGDGHPFEGPGGTLAHAWAPRDGRFHYDSEESWSVGAVRGSYDLETVALHEIGHLLGLDHSSVQNAIMFPTIFSGVTKGLHGDDIQGIKVLYNV